MKKEPYFSPETVLLLLQTDAPLLVEASGGFADVDEEEWN